MADLEKGKGIGSPAGNREISGGPGGQARGTGWVSHDQYWRERFDTRPYAPADRGYDDYRQAYKYGYEAAFTYGYRAWDEDVAHDLERGWHQARAGSPLTWPEAKDAVREAFERARESHTTS